MSPDDFLAKFSNVQARGDQQWQARCPGHDDNRNSLSVSVGDDGRLLLRCHAGCPTADIVRAVGCKMADLFPNGKITIKSTREIAATYDYVDEGGKLAHQTIRYANKQFAQRAPNGDGWSWKLDGVRRVLYRLPELLASSDAVYVGEGEKDCDNLAALGLVATTNAMGAGSWLPDYNESLRGRHVVILPDNDDAGRDHAQHVAKSLDGVAASVKVIALPGLPAKGDVSDWLTSGGTREALEQLAAEASAWEPEPDEPDWVSEGHAQAKDEPERFRIRRLTSRELDAGDFTVNYLIDGVMAERQPLVIAAPMKTLKTTIAAALGVSLALGRDFLGTFRVKQAVNVMFLSGEADKSALQSAGRRIAASHGYDLADVLKIFWSTDLPSLGEDDHLDAVREAIMADEIEVLICDPLYFMLPGQDAGNLMIVGGYLRKLSRLCESLGVSLVVVHHSKRTGVEKYLPPELGHISWSGTAEWARQWILLSRRKDYVPGTGEHLLWMVTGGSAGHSGLHALDVFEGIGSDRTWKVDVRTADDVHQADSDSKAAAKAKAKVERQEADRRELLQAAARFPEGAIQSKLRSRVSMSGQAFSAAVAEALNLGELVEFEASELPNGKGRTLTFYKLAGDQ